MRDELDAELLEVFLTEAAELLPSVATNLRGLASNPNDGELARDLMRKLHTVKGSARMAGAMRLGEAVHEMETRMEAAMQLADVPPIIIDDLHTQYDHAMALYDELQNPDGRRGCGYRSRQRRRLRSLRGRRSSILRQRGPTRAPRRRRPALLLWPQSGAK